MGALNKHPDFQELRDLASYQKVQTHTNVRQLSIIFLISFLGLFLLFTLLPWQQTAAGYGRVIAYSPVERQQDINAPVDGRIQRWHVSEGTRVQAGQLIVELSDNDPEILVRLRIERSALDKRVKAASLAVQTARLNLERQKALFEKGLSAQRSYEQANLDLTRYLVDEANASAELARMDVRLARQLTQSIKAPSDGTILKLMVGQSSQMVKQGQVLALFVPDTESRAVELWMHGNDIPLVHEDRKVRLQFEGWPALQFSGWPSVAVGTFAGKVSFVDASDNGEGKFRIVVVPEDKALWPEPRFLRQGVRTMGWVLLDQVSLGYELWRRFNGFPPSISKAPSLTEYSSKSK